MIEIVIDARWLWKIWLLFAIRRKNFENLKKDLHEKYDALQLVARIKITNHKKNYNHTSPNTLTVDFLIHLEKTDINCLVDKLWFAYRKIIRKFNCSTGAAL